MRINHVGLYVKDLEKMKTFYCLYFDGKASPCYTNEKKRFSSYFITFSQGAKLELMIRRDIVTPQSTHKLGFAHLAFSLGSKDNVVSLTKRLKDDGYEIRSQPRITGDGYYESVISDPEGNAIELTV